MDFSDLHCSRYINECPVGTKEFKRAVRYVILFENKKKPTKFLYLVTLGTLTQVSIMLGLH